MALTELEHHRCIRELDAFLLRKRPPPQARHQVDLSYWIEGQTVYLIEHRVDWKDHTTWHERPFAKMSFVRTRGEWDLYWMRATLKWGRYPTDGKLKHIGKALAEVETDPMGCFWG